MTQGKPTERFRQQRPPAHLLAATAANGRLGYVAYLPGGPHHIAAAGERGMVRHVSNRRHRLLAETIACLRCSSGSAAESLDDEGALRLPGGSLELQVFQS